MKTTDKIKNNKQKKLLEKRGINWKVVSCLTF